jgi:hypothetical protein
LQLTIHKTNHNTNESFILSQAFDIWYKDNIIMSFTPQSSVVSAQHTSTSELLSIAAASAPHQHRALLETGAALATVAIALLLLGIILGAGLFQCYSERTMRSSSTTTAGDDPPSRSSSASRPAKQTLQQPAHQIEESVIDVYTTTEEYDGEDDGDDDSTSATRSPRADTRNPDQPARNPRHSLPKDSYLSEFSMATERADDDDDEEQARPRISSRDYTSYGGDEVSFAGYSISAALDTGTTLQQLPSFRRNNNNNHRRRSESVTVGSSSSFFASEQSTSTIQTSHILAVPNVQRSVTAPPGRLGVTWQVGPDGPIIVAIKTGSPLEDRLFVGDIIIAMNDINLRSLTSLSAMQKVLEETNGMPRIMTVLTKDDDNVTRNHRLPRKAGSS